MTRTLISDPAIRRFTFHTKPDALGRVQFTLEWYDTPRADVMDPRTGLARCQRAQVFFTDPKPYVVKARVDGLKVEIIDETEPRA